MKDYFYLDESQFYEKKYIIRINLDELPFPNGPRGSYSILIARVLNLSYAQMLRYCRDRLGAELIGKNCRYVTPLFERTEEVRLFIRLLNKRMKYIMNEHEFPYEYKEEKDGSVTRIPFEKNEDNTGIIGEV